MNWAFFLTVSWPSHVNFVSIAVTTTVCFVKKQLIFLFWLKTSFKWLILFSNFSTESHVGQELITYPYHVDLIPDIFVDNTCNREQQDARWCSSTSWGRWPLINYNVYFYWSQMALHPPEASGSFLTFNTKVQATVKQLTISKSLWLAAWIFIYCIVL